MVTIEPESERHRQDIRQVTVAAFSKSKFGHNGEAELIDALRVSGIDIVSLVAMQEIEVVGHILFSRVSLRFGDEEQMVGMGLAPMSVLPRLQRTGIGSQLVTTGLRHLSDAGTSFTVVAGDPGFYSRFGFVPAAEYGIEHGFTGMPQDVFLIKGDDKMLKKVGNARAYYQKEFGPQHSDAAGTTTPDNMPRLRNVL